MRERSWKFRRIAVFGTIAACAATVGYLTVAGADTRLAEALASGAFLLWGTTLSSYVFGAVWDDNSRDRLDSRGAGDQEQA